MASLFNIKWWALIIYNIIEGRKDDMIHGCGGKKYFFEYNNDKFWLLSILKTNVYMCVFIIIFA